MGVRPILEKEENKMKNRTAKAMMLGTAMAAALVMGAVTSYAEETTEAVEEAAEEETEVYTGDASLDDPRNQDEIGGQAGLLTHEAERTAAFPVSQWHTGCAPQLQ